MLGRGRRPVVVASVGTVNRRGGELLVGDVVETRNVQGVEGAAELGERAAATEWAYAAPAAERQVEKRLGFALRRVAIVRKELGSLQQTKVRGFHEGHPEPSLVAKA